MKTAIGRLPWVGLWSIALALSLAASAGTPIEWNRARVTELAGPLHEGVKGLRAEVRSRPRDIASMKAWAYYRLLDDLRLIDRETRYLHQALEGGAGRDETLPTYARIAVLRRDCAEEMERQPAEAPVLARIEQARSIIQQMDPYYGFDPTRPDHERVLEQGPARPAGD